MTKWCWHCQHHLPLSSFHKNANKREGHADECRGCVTVLQQARTLRYQRDRAAELSEMQASRLKECPLCQRTLAASAFAKDKAARDGLCHICKECGRERSLAYYYAHHATILAPKSVEHLDPQTTSKVCRTCKATKPLAAFHKARARRDGRSTECKDCKSHYNKDYRARPENAIRLPINHQRYRLTHAQKLSVSIRAWRKRHPGKVRDYGTRRKARKRSLPDTMTEAQVAFLYQYWHFACAVCGEEEGLFGLQLVMDHWIALSDARCPGTVATNMVLLCNGTGGCNTSKNGKDPVLWLTQRYGERKAQAILKKITVYFTLVVSETQ
jgi:hypothetical protein